ncbi:MAG: HAMP domain-containing histidine kinase [Acidobacteriota bacterium]|nr:HAMP domain-containing histidine kinase [Acidobacteriota bacterium]
MVLALIVPIWLALGLTDVLVGETHARSSSTAGVAILGALSGELALGAAAISVFRAWANREMTSALAAAGLVEYGVYKLVVVSRFGNYGPSSSLSMAANVSLVLAFGFLLLSVVNRNEDQRTQWPLNAGVGALLLALVGWGIARPAGNGLLGNYSASSDTGSLLLLLAWAALGLTAIHIGRAERQPLKIWIGFTALCLAQARIGLLVFVDPGIRTLSNAVLGTVAISVTLLGCILSLQESIATVRDLAADSLRALKGSEARRTREATAHDEAIHNLKSALTSITMATHLLVTDGSKPLTEAQKADLGGALKSELERASRLVSREWDGGRRPFVLRDTIAPLVTAQQAQGTSVYWDIPRDVVVLANPEKTYEVIATLLDNARRHAPGSPVEILAAYRGDRVVVSVSDRGPGLPPICVERIFDRGWTTSPQGVGMGVGLYLARSLAEEQEGSLTATDRVGGGATFSLTLPAGAPGRQTVEF